ncbi:hypothetical protein BXZ70DRAFT_138895 [Cristinia sonorae]|uniref:Uncharacterized protein n=1 Tax=Cristinia sonorae TaxID=1940300 RepID=A0A8K0URD4_9AGAR|nr:hypothetical protein BXZ70DRAFT_138895 [Cristinia sonorae]
MTDARSHRRATAARQWTLTRSPYLPEGQCLPSVVSTRKPLLCFDGGMSGAVCSISPTSDFLSYFPTSSGCYSHTLTTDGGPPHSHFVVSSRLWSQLALWKMPLKVAITLLYCEIDRQCCIALLLSGSAFSAATPISTLVMLFLSIPRGFLEGNHGL